MEDPDTSSADDSSSPETLPDAPVPDPVPAPPPPPPPPPGTAEAPPTPSPGPPLEPPSPQAPLPPPPPSTAAPAAGGRPIDGRAPLGPSPAHLTAAAITLVLGGIVAMSVFIVADYPDDYLTDNFVWSTAMLVVLSVPIALLFAWGEMDLSFIGVIVVGAYIYFEVGESGVAAHILVAVLVGMAAGGATGLVRHLARVPSAILTFVAGFLWIAIVARLTVSEQDQLSEGPGEGVVTGLGLPVTLAVITAGVTLAMALVPPLRSVGTGPRARDDQVDPRVIAGYALSGAAASTFGAVASSTTGAGDDVAGFIVPGSNAFLLVVGVVAVAGVVRGAAAVAPVAAVPGTVVIALVAHSVTFIESWKPEDGSLLLTGLVVVTLGISHGLVRLVGNPSGTPPVTQPSPPEVS